ncbi:unnamed protein product [Lupinus luteus]|uniref:FBD domain-containing protein n=1 Tax=Lupinus luteus TaxID=3873 RepID=A0AAV1X180_LUPLU
MEKQSIISFMKELHNINKISMGEGYIKLKTIEIEVKNPYKHVLGLIRFLLANSASLEILKFKVDPGIDKLDIPLMLSISQDLLDMERASPRAQVKFIYPHFGIKEVVCSSVCDYANDPSSEEDSPVCDYANDPSSEEASLAGIKTSISERLKQVVPWKSKKTEERWVWCS